MEVQEANGESRENPIMIYNDKNNKKEENTRIRNSSPLKESKIKKNVVDDEKVNNTLEDRDNTNKIKEQKKKKTEMTPMAWWNKKT